MIDRDEIDVIAIQDRIPCRQGWETYLGEFAQWKHYLTLTFRDEVYPDIAMSKYMQLVNQLNKSLYGSNYVRKYGHSYFSYLLGIEYQKRGVIHFHVLIDKPIDYALAHKIWNKIAGFAWIEPIENPEALISYCTKYVIKGGDLLPYRSKNKKSPNNLPYWWGEKTLF